MLDESIQKARELYRMGGAFGERDDASPVWRALQRSIVESFLRRENELERADELATAAKEATINVSNLGADIVALVAEIEKHEGPARTLKAA